MAMIRRILAAAIMVVIGHGSITTARADAMTNMAGGGLIGGVVGGLAGGGTGAVIGVAAGAGLGAMKSSADEQKRTRKAEEAKASAEQERVDLEKQRWEAEQQQQQEQMDAQQQQQQQASQEQQLRATAVQATLIADLQRSLTLLGYDTGGIDGQVGPGTTSAIQAYQTDQGLLVDGQPSEQLLQHMRQQGG